jgi:hypothetical protein
VNGREPSGPLYLDYVDSRTMYLEWIESYGRSKNYFRHIATSDCGCNGVDEPAKSGCHNAITRTSGVRRKCKYPSRLNLKKICQKVCATKVQHPFEALEVPIRINNNSLEGSSPTVLLQKLIVVESWKKKSSFAEIKASLFPFLDTVIPNIAYHNTVFRTGDS